MSCHEVLVEEEKRVLLAEGEDDAARAETTRRDGRVLRAWAQTLLFFCFFLVFSLQGEYVSSFRTRDGLAGSEYSRLTSRSAPPRLVIADTCCRIFLFEKKRKKVKLEETTFLFV